MPPDAGLPRPPDPRYVADRLRELLEALDRRPPLDGSELVAERHRLGATNLADYLALRRHDLHDLRGRLARLGLSSLGRSEPHVRSTLEATHRAGAALAGRPAPHVDASGFDDGPRALAANTEAVLGPEPAGRRVRIMVTLPSAAADDGGALVGSLLAAGMDCARINTAHDDPDAWHRMIAGVRAAARNAGRPCAVVADLPGPELRTGPMVPGPRALRIRPGKDEIGRVVAPAVVVLTRGTLAGPGADSTVVPVEGDLVDDLTAGDEVALVDARGKARSLQVLDVGDGWVKASVDRTTWLRTGGELRRVSSGAGSTGRIGMLPPRDVAIRLADGDHLVLRADAAPSRPASAGEVASIGCTIPAVLGSVAVGDRVEFDDGAIGGVVVRAGGGSVVVEISRGGRLRAEKGICLPDSDLPLEALGPDDLLALDAIGTAVDAVAPSFVRRPADVHDLHCELASRKVSPGVLLKIETPLAFANLPELLIAAMRSDRCGVMIARGDLAIEAGYERTAELQEEILWACEAAHLPVVRAAPVLEGLAKAGRPSGAEVTDAAAETRAECVMLNAGPHVVAAVEVLDDVLSRMTAHQEKERTLLRQLRPW